MTKLRMIPMALVVLAVLAAPVALAAERGTCDLSPCTLDDTLKTCSDKLAAAEAEQSFQSLETSLSQETILQGLMASSTPSTNPAVNASVKDFLPSFLSSLGIDGLDLDEGNLTFDKNFDLDGDWKLSVGATAFASSEIYSSLEDALKESLAADQLSTVTSSLEKEIEDFDKVDFKAVVAKQRGGEGQIDRWGRDTDLYGDLLDFWGIKIKDEKDNAVEKLSEELLGRTEEMLSTGRLSSLVSEDPELEKLMTEQKAFARKGDEADPQDAETQTPDPLQTQDPLGSGRLEVLHFESVCSLVAALKAEASREDMKAVPASPLTEKQGKQLQSLIGNQPQAFVEWVREERSGKVLGPRSTSVGACYEVGVSGNINDFLHWAKDDSNDCDWEKYEKDDDTSYDLPNLECLKRYLEKGGQQPEKQHRIAFALAYESQDAYEFDLTDEAFDFALPKVDKTVASLVYGRYFPDFSLFDQGEQGTRVDLEVKYEDPSEDGETTAEKATTMEAEERFVATLTFSQRLAGRADLSVSLVYANEPEFLGMVDEEVTANFGIKWSSKPKKEEE